MFERAMNEARKEQERRGRIHTASPHLPVVVHGEEEEPATGVEDPALLAILSVVIVLAAVVVLVTSL